MPEFRYMPVTYIPTKPLSRIKINMLRQNLCVPSWTWSC